MKALMNTVRDTKGITLVELVVVIGIITILISLATIAFNSYQRTYNIENEVKTLYSDLMGVRMRAMNENRSYVVAFSGNSYTAAIDNNSNRVYDAGDTAVSKYSKSGLKYGLTWNLVSANGDSFNGISFDTRGLVYIGDNPAVNDENDPSLPHNHIRVSQASDSEYDCIKLSATRIKPGKWNTSTGKCEIR